MKILALLLVLAADILVAQAPPLPRSRTVIREFARQTGYPNGRPGWIVDHRLPLCLGGADILGNLQWQERQASYRKDVYERYFCAEMTRQGLGRLHPEHP